jgi:uncharacterized delta-60 repeat protein
MVRARLVVRFCVVSSLVLAPSLGCQSLLGIEDTRVEEPGFTFEIRTVNASLPLNGTAALEVSITRTGGFAGEVEVKPSVQPSGLIAPAISIPASETTGMLSVGAVAPLALGDEVAFELQATAVGTELPVRSASLTRAQVTGKLATYDVSFGPTATGLTPVRFGNDDNGSIRGLYLTGDKKLLAIGYGFSNGGMCTATRVTPGGLIDTTFDNVDAGILRFSFNSGSSGETPTCMAIGQQTDGRLVVIAAHRANASYPPDVGFVRMSAAGVIGDLEFNNGGRARVDLMGNEETSDGLVLRDGRLLAVGLSTDKAFVTRATSNGYLDTTFASPAGYFKAPSPRPSRAEGVAIDSRDRILVAGWIGAAGQRDVLLFRLSADGQLDTTFGDNGAVVVGSPSLDERGRAVAVRPDGRIVVAGHSNKNGNDDFEIRQFLDTGAPDPSFGDGGVVTSAITADDDRVADMILLPNGETLAVGNSGTFYSEEDASNGGPVVARYTSAGALDKFFSADGIETAIPIGTSGVLRTVMLFDDHRVILGGGNEGGVPGPGTFGILVRMWM